MYLIGNVKQCHVSGSPQLYQQLALTPFYSQRNKDSTQRAHWEKALEPLLLAVGAPVDLDFLVLTSFNNFPGADQSAFPRDWATSKFHAGKYSSVFYPTWNERCIESTREHHIFNGFPKV